ncbi:hypothetical protein [Salmonirosea aquatica]|uniref:Uncharacterized protein n=1 Tax=Salmonirosea aquatica TaxID=2654236 RepID=A0A7C9BG12_9BACT|nr:hypothetical protein [Cytophagaceae bacterium SJW1-29]
MKVFSVLFYLLLCLVTSVLGQVTNPRDLASIAPGVQAALSLYDSATVESQHLYNGPQYYIYDSPADDHQFYLSENWTMGSVFYDGQLFRDVPILYDIVKDQLVVRYKQSFGNVALQSPKVRYFTIPEHTFLRVEADTGRVEGLRTGFYDQLYDGKTKLVARRTKERQQDLSERRVIIRFPEKNLFYLYQAGTYHPVHTKKSVLGYLEDQKRPLKKYLREQKLSFRENREAAILGLATYYDELTKP